jgi:hypothetical protein
MWGRVGWNSKFKIQNSKLKPNIEHPSLRARRWVACEIVVVRIAAILAENHRKMP